MAEFPGANIDWYVLEDFIEGLPGHNDDIKLIRYMFVHDHQTWISDDTYVDGYGDCEKVKITTTDEHEPFYIVPVNDLHNLIVNAVKHQFPQEAESYINNFIKEHIWKNMLQTYAKHVLTLSKYLSFEKNGLKVTVTIPDSLIKLLEMAASGESYKQISMKNKHLIRNQL